MTLAEKGMAQAKKYDEIDKAPEEKARGITINTAREYDSSVVQANKMLRVRRFVWLTGGERKLSLSSTKSV